MLSFQQEMGREEIAAFLGRLVQVAEEGPQAAFALARAQVGQFPRCDSLALNVALTLEGVLTMAGREGSAEEREWIQALYRQAAESRDQAVACQAQAMLFGRAMEEGSRYIEAIRRANDAIPGEEISEKLYRLEALIKKIFEVLKQKPEQLPKLRKFMQYYMPTTLKLVQTYQELDAQPTEGENIRQSKAEIEKTLDTINLAYEKLLDSFFEDAAMDIRSDITVLETMLAQEGLTKNHFENQSGGE